MTAHQVMTVCVLHAPDDAAALGDRIAITYSDGLIQTATLEVLFDKPENEMLQRLLRVHLLGHRISEASNGGEDLSRS